MAEAASFLLKIGNTEIHLSGSENYLATQIPVALEFVGSKVAAITTSVPADSPESKPAQNPNAKVELGMNTIGAKLSVKSGPDLILAAAISLNLKGKNVCSRKELMEETKLATNYFKQTVVKNFSSSLKTLTGQQRILEQGADSYALPADVLKELTGKLV